MQIKQYLFNWVHFYPTKDELLISSSVDFNRKSIKHLVITYVWCVKSNKI